MKFLTYLQRFLESSTKVTIEVGVYDWVQSGIKVADPKEYSNNNARCGATRAKCGC